MTTQLGTMKVVGIQDKLGYSLVTFEIPDDCKQFLIEHAIRDLLTKVAKETEEKYGSTLPEPEQTVDNNVNKVYNEDEADDDGWISNKGVQPACDWELVDTLWFDGAVELGYPAVTWNWRVLSRTGDCLNKQSKGGNCANNKAIHTKHRRSAF